jgi:hypothetical protein
MTRAEEKLMPGSDPQLSKTTADFPSPDYPDLHTILPQLLSPALRFWTSSSASPIPLSKCCYRFLRMAKVEHQKETVLGDPNLESFEICRVQVFT